MKPALKIAFIVLPSVVYLFVHLVRLLAWESSCRQESQIGLPFCGGLDSMAESLLFYALVFASLLAGWQWRFFALFLAPLFMYIAWSTALNLAPHYVDQYRFQLVAGGIGYPLLALVVSFIGASSHWIFNIVVWSRRRKSARNSVTEIGRPVA